MSADAEARAAALKEQGNAFLGNKKFAKAIEKYTEAIALTPGNHVLYSNRSGVLLELGRVAEALADAEMCVKLLPTWPKGYYRLGIAFEAQGRSLDAVNAFDDGLKLDPKDELLLKCRARAGRAMEKDAAAVAAAGARREAKIASGELKLPLQEILRSAEATVDPAVVRSSSSAAAVSLAQLASKCKGVVLTSTEGRGRGLVAARSFPAYAEIFTDTAAVWTPPFCEKMGSSMPAIAETAPWVRAAGPHALEAILLQLEPFASAMADPATVLPPLSSAELYMRTFRANAIGCVFDEQGAPDARAVSAIAPLFAMLNHDCAANCIAHGEWTAGSGGVGGSVTVRVSSLRPIAAGEELCISYVGRNQQRKERQSRLLAQYGFSCSCARCSAGLDDSASETTGEGDAGAAAAAGSAGAGTQAAAAISSGDAPTTPHCGVEDTVVFQCPKCKDGAIVHAARGACCDSCGHAPTATALSEWSKQRMAFLARPRDFATCVLEDTTTCLHLRDNARCGMAYSQLSAGAARPLLEGEPTKAAAVLGRFATVLDTSRLWETLASQVLLLAGHAHTFAGDAASARAAYARAAERLRGEYGPASVLAKLVGSLVDKLPSGRAGVEQFEQKRAAHSNWVSACGLPKVAVQRWSTSPIMVSSPPIRLPNGAPVPSDASERAALAGLTVLSELILRSKYEPGRSFDATVAQAMEAASKPVPLPPTAST